MLNMENVVSMPYQGKQAVTREAIIIYDQIRTWHQISSVFGKPTIGSLHSSIWSHCWCGSSVILFVQSYLTGPAVQGSPFCDRLGSARRPAVSHGVHLFNLSRLPDQGVGQPGLHQSQVLFNNWFAETL